MELNNGLTYDKRVDITDSGSDLYSGITQHASPDDVKVLIYGKYVPALMLDRIYNDMGPAESLILGEHGYKGGELNDLSTLADQMLVKIIPFYKFNKDSHFWVFNRQGSILFKARHPEDSNSNPRSALSEIITEVEIQSTEFGEDGDRYIAEVRFDTGLGMFKMTKNIGTPTIDNGTKKQITIHT